MRPDHHKVYNANNIRRMARGSQLGKERNLQAEIRRPPPFAARPIRHPELGQTLNAPDQLPLRQLF